MYAYVGDELVSAVDAVYGSLWAEVSYGGRLNDNYLLVYLCRNERERGLQSSVPRFIRLKASEIFVEELHSVKCRWSPPPFPSLLLWSPQMARGNCLRRDMCPIAPCATWEWLIYWILRHPPTPPLPPIPRIDFNGRYLDFAFFPVLTVVFCHVH